MRHEMNANGDQCWYDDRDLYHRDDGPAIIYQNGYQLYYQHGKLHRLDGPAVIHSDNHCKNYSYSARLEWYINGVNYSEEEFLRIVKMKELL
jgi:hypothetical protein